MRTTIDLKDGLFKAAKIAAIERGVSLKELFHAALEHEVGGDVSQHSSPAPAVPTVRSQKPGSIYLTPEQVHDILVKEERAAYATARRR